MTPRLEISFPYQMQRQFLFGEPYSPAPNEFLLNHARSGIMLALQAMHLPQGSGVGVMAYNCHTVMNAVSQAGMKPVFIDVTDNLQIDMADLHDKMPQMKVLVLTHLFGIENDVRQIKELYPNLPVIEDCAHAYGKTNKVGDFIVFSIGQGKLPSLGDGGILRVQNEYYLQKVKDLYVHLPQYSKWQSAKLFIRLCLKSFLYRPLIYRSLTLPLKRNAAPPSAIVSIKPHQMNQGVWAMYATERNTVEDKIAVRLQHAEKLREQLLQLSDVKRAWYGENAFMMIVETDNPIKLQQKLLKKSIDSATHFSHSIGWAKDFGYTDGDCANAERLMYKLLMIPTYKNIDL